MPWQLQQYGILDSAFEFGRTVDHKIAGTRLKSAYGDPLAYLFFPSTLQYKAAKLSFPVDGTEEKWKFKQCAHN